jgi:glycerol-3-phosphate dehydrogenase
MITNLEDFLRRRSKIALIAKKRDIERAPGLLEACTILFGDDAQHKFDEYFADRERRESLRPSVPTPMPAAPAA